MAFRVLALSIVSLASQLLQQAQHANTCTPHTLTPPHTLPCSSGKWLVGEPPLRATLQSVTTVTSVPVAVAVIQGIFNGITV